MQPHKLAALSVGLVIASTLAGCSGGGSGGSSNGTLSLGLFDAPVSGVNQISLDITEVDLKPTNGNAISFMLSPAVGNQDLLNLTPDNFAALLDSVSVPAGHYEWVQLKVDSANSYAMTDAGAQVPLTVPSGIARLVSGFTITADQKADFRIDWNAREGLVDPVGTAGYKLQPALRMIDMQQYGTLEGSIDATALLAYSASDGSGCATGDPNVDVGNVVYIYAGSGATPGTDTPVATADANPNADNTAYVYKTILSPGQYTVAFTCQAELTTASPPGTPAFWTPVNATITNGADVTVNF